MDYEKLFILSEFTFYLVATDESSFADIYLQLSSRYKEAVIRMIRGKKSRNLTNFFNEIASALQFPYYFGENWPAFHEVIIDLDWLEGSAYLLMFGDANLFLDKENEDFRILLEILSRANKEWLTPNKYIPRNRQPTPFHVLFHCSVNEIADFTLRLTKLGIKFEII